MRVLAARSEVVRGEGGWLWLQPSRDSLRLRHTFASFLLALLILMAMATATLIPLAAAVPATAVVAWLAAALVVRTAREGRTRLGMSGVGLLVQQGASFRQVSWAAVRGLSGRQVGGRVRIALDAGRDSMRTRAGFDDDAARAWLTQATCEARRRNLDPVASGDGLGFTTT